MKMPSCPRCTGCTAQTVIITEEGALAVVTCLNCGFAGGDALIEHHQGLDTPPEPCRELSQPIYEPTHQRLSYRRIDGQETSVER